MLKFLIVVLLVAVAIYLVTRAIERRGVSRQPRRGPRGGAVQPPRQVAPDDDPDFLWDLERKRRREAKEHGQTPPGRDGTPETSQDGTDQDGTAQGEGTGEESTGTS